MAYTQCSLSGFASSWFLRLHKCYKKRLICPCVCIRKALFFTGKCTYAQVEAQDLTEKETRNVHQYVLKVQQLVEEGLCFESAGIINLKYREVFPRGLPKRLEAFAHKRQVNHTSIVMETSVPLLYTGFV